VHAQVRYTILPVKGVNTPKDDILCGMMLERPIVVSNDRQDLVNDYAWDTHFIYQLKVTSRGKTYYDLQTPTRLLPFPGVRSEGTASFNPQDSILYFSSAENYGEGKGASLKIYRTHWNGRIWSRPFLMPFCEGVADYAHPYFDPSLQVLVFSSNRSGGIGGMDIWYTSLNDARWTDPVNLGIQVNTGGNEVFPSIFQENIYFSSNGILPARGYELFYCERSSQWKAPIQLPDPLNSAGDDVMIYFLNENKGFVSSLRSGGKGGDDVYLFEREIVGMPTCRYHAELEVKGLPYPGAGLMVTNDLKEVVLEGTTDTTGQIPLRALRLGQKLRFSLIGVSPLLYSESILYIVDEFGNRIHTLRLNEFGWVELELLPFDYSDINLFPNADRSWLSVSVEGQLIGKQSGDVRPGEPITIVDDQNKPVALAYTKDGGMFNFDNLAPELSYTFRLSESSKAEQVIILEKNQEIVLPVLREEAIYKRLSQEEAIAIVNEANQVVHVSAQDLFVVNRIYFEYNKSNLTEDAIHQLEQLAWLLNRNPALYIEVHSHTDSRGGSADNLKLSQLRAESVMRFLESKEVGRSRMKAVGRGEQALLNGCSDGVQCIENEHAINRRTEIRFQNR